MPLKSGSSQKVISSNIAELMHEVMGGDGRIGNSPPPANKEAAQKQAVAIALKKAGKAKPGKPKGGM